MNEYNTYIPKFKEIEAQFLPILEFVHKIGRNYEILTFNSVDVDWQKWVLRIDYDKVISDLKVDSFFKIAKGREEWYFDRILTNPHMRPEILEHLNSEICKWLTSLKNVPKFVWESFDVWEVNSSIEHEFLNKKIFTANAGRTSPKRILVLAMHRVDGEIEKILEYFKYYGLEPEKTGEIPFKKGFTIELINNWVIDVLKTSGCQEADGSIKQTYGHSIIDYIRDKFCKEEFANNRSNRQKLATVFRFPNTYKVISTNKTWTEYANINSELMSFISKIEKISTYPKQ
jgi:hypothetical protein